MKGLTWVLSIIAWGFLIAIGFWLGHKLTARLDEIPGKIKARRIADRVVNEMEVEGTF